MRHMFCTCFSLRTWIIIQNLCLRGSRRINRQGAELAGGGEVGREFPAQKTNQGKLEEVRSPVEYFSIFLLLHVASMK